MPRAATFLRGRPNGDFATHPSWAKGWRQDEDVVDAKSQAHAMGGAGLGCEEAGRGRPGYGKGRS